MGEWEHPAWGQKLKFWAWDPTPPSHVEAEPIGKTSPTRLPTLQDSWGEDATHTEPSWTTREQRTPAPLSSPARPWRSVDNDYYITNVVAIMAPPPGWLPSLLLQPHLSGPPHRHQSHPAPNPLSPPPRLSHQAQKAGKWGWLGVGVGAGDSKRIPIPSYPPRLPSPFPPGAQTLLKSPPSPPPTSPEVPAQRGASLPGKWRHLQAPGRAAASAPHARGLATASPRLLNGAVDRVSHQVSGGPYTG